ncbi:MAG: DNA repair protein RecO [Chloroflexota bacterium]|nr:DNA repair protein RecO [Dehalococcoidia bacterium]MDW8252773.1 DNA repair protein RecO [Chloroflexota bacterium]
MRAPRTYRTEGVVLRYYNFGEADRILSLITPDHGKLRVLAKGVRRPGSKLSGHLDLFCRSQLLIAKGQTLDVIAGASTISSYLQVRQDLWRTSCAFYLLELTDRLSEERLENRPLYDLLVECLAALERARRPEVLLRYFDLHALDRSGFRPELRRCLVCRREIEPQVNRFGPQGVTCPDCPADMTSWPISVDALKVLRFLQANPLNAALRFAPSPRVLGEVEGQLRRAITAILEREMKSTEFLSLVRSQTAESKIAPPLAR